MADDIREDILESVRQLDEQGSGGTGDTSTGSDNTQTDPSESDDVNAASKIYTDTSGTQGTAKEITDTTLKQGQTSLKQGQDGKPVVENKDAKQTDTSSATPQPWLDKAPHTWSPAAKEKWKEIDPAIRQEIKRRETDMARGFAESKQSRDFHRGFQEVMAPYVPFAKAMGHPTIMHAIDNVMQTAVMLQSSPPVQRAQLVAKIINDFGVDLRILDSVLAGSPVANPVETRVQELIRQELAPVRQFMDGQARAGQQNDQVITQRAESDLEAFLADPKNEFASNPEIMSLMSDLIDLDLAKGRSSTLTDIYSRAILLHEPTRKVVEARKSTEQVNRNNERANKARQGAVSLTSSDSVPTRTASQTADDEPDDIRGSLVRAIQQLGGSNR